jgi:hypothetical protein
MKKTIYQNAIEQIDVLFDHVITNAASDFLRVDIGIVNNDLAQEIFSQTNFSIENYEISIDSHGLRHIMNQHGSEKEVLRGQVSIARKQVRLLIRVFENINRIFENPKSFLGKESIVVETIIEGLTYVSVWEIRKVTSIKKGKKCRIILLTFYVKKLKI